MRIRDLQLGSNLYGKKVIGLKYVTKEGDSGNVYVEVELLNLETYEHKIITKHIDTWLEGVIKDKSYWGEYIRLSASVSIHCEKMGHQLQVNEMETLYEIQSSRPSIKYGIGHDRDDLYTLYSREENKNGSPLVEMIWFHKDDLVKLAMLAGIAMNIQENRDIKSQEENDDQHSEESNI